MIEFIYLIKVAESRTGKRRSYRAFTIRDASIVDATSEVCRDARKAGYTRPLWNNISGALELCEPYQWQDGPALQEILKDSIIKML